MCKSCGASLQRWGLNRNGSQRFRCPKCGTSETRKREDISHVNHRKLYEAWLFSKFTLTEFGQRRGVTRRTLDRWFKPFRKTEIEPDDINLSEMVLIIDGYYVEVGATVLIAQAHTNQVVSWSFTYAENFSTWLNFLETINSFPLAIVCDGQKGMFKAIKLRFPGVIIQRCQFHVIHHVNLLLTKHPETLAARELKQLVNRITQVKTELDLREWLYSFKVWYQNYQPFLTEKTYQDYSPFTNKQRWHYTHGHLHAAYFHLKQAVPYLFQYLKHPSIPNTSNRIEGGVNAPLKRLIDQHRGMKLGQRRQLIATLLKKKQLLKPTQNVT